MDWTRAPATGYPHKPIMLDHIQPGQGPRGAIMTTSNEKKDEAYKLLDKLLDEANRPPASTVDLGTVLYKWLYQAAPWKTGRSLWLWRPALTQPMWLAKAPAEVRTLLTLVSSPCLVHVLVSLLLAPLGWLVNLVTGRWYCSTWGFRVVRVTRIPILLAGFPWLLSLFSPTVAWVAFCWMLVYLVLRVINGSALQESEALGAMENNERMEQSLRG